MGMPPMFANFYIPCPVFAFEGARDYMFFFLFECSSLFLKCMFHTPYAYLLV